MKRQGSLFLWDLKIEGKIIYNKDNIDLFTGLEKFSRDKEDIILYKKLLASATLSLSRNGANYYDLSILSLVARNTLILLCYKINNPSFGRKTLFYKAKQMFGDKLPLTIDVYNELTEYRLIYSRLLGNRALADKLHTRYLVEQLNNWLVYSMDKIGGGNDLTRVVLLLKKEVSGTLYNNFEIFTEFERDLYISLMRLCKKEYKYVLKGMKAVHKNDFYCNLNESSLNKYVSMAFKIYDSFEEFKKFASGYEKDLENIFDNYLDKRAIYNKKILQKVSNSKIKKIL